MPTEDTTILLPRGIFSGTLRAMLDPQPRVPANLNPLSRELLELLRGQPGARHLILGGGVALSHYLEYRETVDVDAWWRQDIGGEAQAEAIALVRGAMQELGAAHALEFSEREFGDTRSLELRRGSKKVFSFQVARRDIHLDEPRAAEWQPLWIESFRDNLGAKMNALVERGAPRDFVDIATVCQRGLVTEAECWAAWRAKGAPRHIEEAKCIVLRSLTELEGRRPLERIDDGEARRRAGEVRAFVRTRLCARNEPHA